MRVLIALGLIAVSCSAAGGSPTRYDVCQLAPIPGVFFDYQVMAMNDRGEVVGTAASTGGWPAFIWDRNRGARALETLATSSVDRAVAVNSWGLVAGESVPPAGTGVAGAVIWTPQGAIHCLVPATDPYQPGIANGVNDWGQVVGGNGSVSFVWDYWRGIRQLDPVPGLEFSVAQDINNRGLIVIAGFGSSGSGSALIDARTRKQQRVPLETGYRLNDRGQVLGLTLAEGGYHAAVWDRKHGVRDLGEFAGGGDASYPRDINNAGAVVGLSNAADGDRAFLWTPRHGLLDLNALIDSSQLPAGVVLFDAIAINNRGWIVANSLQEGILRPYLLTPRRPRGRDVAWPGCL